MMYARLAACWFCVLPRLAGGGGRRRSRRSEGAAILRYGATRATHSAMSAITSSRLSSLTSSCLAPG